jgi:glycosyltransferase involved in cell wall biosynthesis
VSEYKETGKKPHMKLGYLYSRYPVPGPSSCDVEEMLELQRLGHEITIGSVHPPLTPFAPQGSELLEGAVSYAPPPSVLTAWERNARASGDWPKELLRRHKKQFKATTNPLKRAREALFFAKLFSQQGIEHFRVHVAGCAAHTALFVKELTGLPFSLMAHGQWFMKELGNDDLLREICAAAEFVAAESDYSRGLLVARCPDSAAKIHRVYNGIDLTRFGAVTEPGAEGQKPLRLLSVARLMPLKGFEYLVEAAAELRRRNLDFTCEIVGDGPLRAPLLTKIQELGLTEHVRHIGGMRGATLREKIRECDIFVLPAVVDETASSDIFPATILDVMGLAKPVVTTLVGGIPEAVVHNTTGVLVPPCDSVALADALATLMREPWLRVAMGRAARARIEQQFQIAATVPSLLELLGRARHENPPKPVMRRDPANRSTIAYLVDEWPDPRVPLLEAELVAMADRGITPQVFVCRTNAGMRPSRLGGQLSASFEFLPDAMVLEQEWQAEPELGNRVLSAFGAEYAVTGAELLCHGQLAISLLPRLREAGIRHLHATDTRALLTALMVSYLMDVNISAVIERDTALPRETIRAAASRCVGGRAGSRRLVRSVEPDFIFDSNAWSRSLASLRAGLIALRMPGLAGNNKLWQEWSDRLVRWA